jgi:hypothetical protein
MNSKTLTLAGAVVLIIGLFLPAINMMGMGLSLLMPAGQIQALGLIPLACAVLAGALALMGQGKWAVVPGIAALGFLVWKFLEAQSSLSGTNADVPPEAAELVAQLAPTLNYLGWGVMGLGAVLILVGGAMGWKGSAAAPPAA